MRLLVNTLSIGSMSGNHVVYGFLRPYCRHAIESHSIEILHYESMAPPDELIELGVKSIPLSDRYRHWTKRSLWEFSKLPKLVKERQSDIVLTVSGAFLPRCPVPQVVLCQNPWCYRPIVHRDWKDRLKARLQRVGYSKAFRHAAMMIYISEHLRDLYRSDNQGVREAPSRIAYVGLDQLTFDTAAKYVDLERRPMSILSVSAMAAWKGAHTLIDALAILRARDVPATLNLVGPWPDDTYRRRIDEQIDRLNLQPHIEILGRVSDEELQRQYATAMVYALPSHCESFGIPAAEAMAYGTPVVSTDCCAISEICEPAGIFGPAEDPESTADAIERLLVDEPLWQRKSQAGRKRAAELTWENCYQAFKEIENLC